MRAHVATVGAVDPQGDQPDAADVLGVGRELAALRQQLARCRICSISFSAARSRSTMSLTRSGSSSGRALSASESWATSTCSRARNR